MQLSNEGKETIDLEILQRGIQMLVTDKFAKVLVNSEWSPKWYAEEISIIGWALGEVLETIEHPLQWKRFIKRKDCPKYMKEIITYHINAYYPKLSLPEEPSWLTISNAGTEYCDEPNE